MRVECPQCKELSIAHILEVRDRVVCFSCTACSGHFSHLVVSEEHESKSVSDKSVGACPKCGDVGEQDTSACKQCGLSKEHFSSFQSGEKKAGNDSVAVAWKELQTKWHSDSAHKTFVNSLLASGDYREGAAKYRHASATESKRERCEEMMLAIQKMAAVALLSSKPKLAEEKEPFGSVMLLIVACLILAVASVLYAVMRKGEKQGSTQPTNLQKEQRVPGPRMRSIPMKRTPRGTNPRPEQRLPRQPISKPTRNSQP